MKTAGNNGSTGKPATPVQQLSRCPSHGSSRACRLGLRTSAQLSKIGRGETKKASRRLVVDLAACSAPRWIFGPPGFGPRRRASPADDRRRRILPGTFQVTRPTPSCCCRRLGIRRSQTKTFLSGNGSSCFSHLANRPACLPAAWTRAVIYFALAF